MGVTKILCSFKLVLEGKAGKEIPDVLHISGINDDKNQWVPLPTTFTRDKLPVDNDGISKPGQLKQWKYLEPVVNQLNFEENTSVGLLIGANCTKALEPIQVLQGRNGKHFFQSKKEVKENIVTEMLKKNVQP